MLGDYRPVSSGKDLENRVATIAESLGLQVRSQVKVGKRIWGADRFIDIVATEPTSRQSLGIECKYQAKGGTTEEKIPTTIKDIEAWPIPGIVVIDGVGFSTKMRAYLYSTGKVIDLEDLEVWLTLFFGL